MHAGSPPVANQRHAPRLRGHQRHLAGTRLLQLPGRLQSWKRRRVPRTARIFAVFMQSKGLHIPITVGVLGGVLAVEGDFLCTWSETEES